MTVTTDRSTLALDVLQAALSLAVLRFQKGPEAVTEAEIEKAAELFDVGEDEADQVMIVYEMLVAFGESIATSRLANTKAD
jgi:hypothetical protein